MTIIGTAGDDILNGTDGNDTIRGLEGADQITLGAGADTVAFDATSFGSGPDQITDFSIADERFLLNAADFGVDGDLLFTNALAENLAGSDANVIVLQDADDDNNPDTVFNARSAARLIGEQVEDAGAGFFVYFNSAFDLNRLVFSTDLSDGEAAFTVLGALTDLTGQDAIDALPTFTAANFALEFTGDDGNDVLTGSSGDDVIDAQGGDDLVRGQAGADDITLGDGADTIAFDDTSFGSGPDQIADFSIAEDRFLLDPADFGVDDDLVFANALAEDLTGSDANVIVLQDADDDNNPDTVFNARSAARLIAEQVEEAGEGFFLYFNSALDLNRLVYTPDLSDGEAAFTILNALTDVTGQDAIDALPAFTVDNFAFEISGDDGRDRLRGDDSDDVIDGGGGNDRVKGRDGDDTIFGGDGDDRIKGGDGDDTIFGGAGNDVIRGGRGSDSLFGEDGDDVLTASKDGSLLDGGAGNDLLRGGKEADTFVFNGGEDVIRRFDEDEDTIDLSAFDTSFDAILASVEESRKSVTLDLGDGNTLDIRGLDLDDLSADLFSF